jgi:hypothetical protein
LRIHAPAMRRSSGEKETLGRRLGAASRRRTAVFIEGRSSISPAGAFPWSVAWTLPGGPLDAAARGA